MQTSKNAAEIVMVGIWVRQKKGAKTQGGEGGGGEMRAAWLCSSNMNTGLDYLKPGWIILFYWLLKLGESGPLLLQVSQILQLILCSRHWIHDPLRLKADLGPLSASGSFDTLRDGFSVPMRWSLGRPLAGLSQVHRQLRMLKTWNLQYSVIPHFMGICYAVWFL